MANKAIMIGVGIFITLAITSGVLMVIDNIKVIYDEVYETDNNITSSFNEFDKYDGAELLGIDLLNTAKKYAHNDAVELYLTRKTSNRNINIPIGNVVTSKYDNESNIKEAPNSFTRKNSNEVVRVNVSGKYFCTVEYKSKVTAIYFKEI